MQLFVSYLWIVNLLFGAYLWSYTLRIGRPESSAQATALPRWILFVHPTLAVAGLGMWGVYSASDSDLVAWASFVTLVLTAVLGDVLAVKTHKGRRERIKVTTAAAVHEGAPLPPSRRRVEDEMPTSVLAVHGIIATGLIVAVLVECIRITW
ncbi:hypothetical protein [Nocardioides perillae]|uniref:Uncharacterized protein n=1 Tax=Nocardioides perillae TaxID=1119534 RepID=A0A7Y9UV89_9ACTN|nr:hypothetical protein [Nocardioides perillae]NYG55935.1 hypothetical protein [Nocardioides perillae]